MDLDKSIITQCRKGDVNAQKALYDFYRHRWFTICLRYLVRREDALDVLQDSLVNIYTKMDQFDDAKGNFQSWSCKIVVNQCIMFQRKYWNKPEVAGINLELVDRGEYSLAESNLSLEEITKLIQTLPLGYRLVFNLHILDGYSHQEIADKLGINVGTSKSQLFKAKAILKKKLNQISHEEVKMIS